MNNKRISAKKGVYGVIESISIIAVFAVVNVVSREFDLIVSMELNEAISVVVSSMLYGGYRFFMNHIKHRKRY